MAPSVVIATTHWAYPRKDDQAELIWVTGYMPQWFTCPLTVDQLSLPAWPSTNAQIPLHTFPVTFP